MESPQGEFSDIEISNPNSATVCMDKLLPNGYSPNGYVRSPSPKFDEGNHTRSSATIGISHARQLFALSDLKLNNVRVFTDKAELCRQMTTTFKAGEIVEVMFDNVTSAIEKDSIRVELRGASTILDVNFNVKSFPELEGTWSQRVFDLRNELKSCQRQTDILKKKIQRLEKQRNILEAYADSLAMPKRELNDKAIEHISAHNFVNNHGKVNAGVRNGPINEPLYSSPQIIKRCDSEIQSQISNPFDPTYLGTIEGFFHLYDEQADRLDTLFSKSKDEFCCAEERIDELKKELSELERHHCDHMVREISVLIEPREDGPVDVMVTYVVTRCSWKPAYDIRLFNNDGSMKIIYYGLVRQATGEDWTTSRMTLSTAKPCSEGLPSKLGPRRLFYKQSSSYTSNDIVNRSAQAMLDTRNTKQQSESSQRPANIIDGHLYSKNNAAAIFSELSDQPFDADILSLTDKRTRPNISITSLQDQLATVLFEVPRPPALVSCTNEWTRVTIGLIDINPNYSYVSIPKCSLAVFLKAAAVNNSSFHILPGQTNIYSDNTYTGKSKLHSVAPGDEFFCDLGAVTGIDVNYRPMFRSKEAAINGRQKTSVNIKQLIDVRNNFPRPVQITVVDQIPFSGEDKIKVTLVDPAIKNPEKYDKSKPVRMNKYNNIEWDIDLNPGETKELSLRYFIEYPAFEEIEVRVFG